MPMSSAIVDPHSPDSWSATWLALIYMQRGTESAFPLTAKVKVQDHLSILATLGRLGEVKPDDLPKMVMAPSVVSLFTELKSTPWKVQLPVSSILPTWFGHAVLWCKPINARKQSTYPASTALVFLHRSRATTMELSSCRLAYSYRDEDVAGYVGAAQPWETDQATCLGDSEGSGRCVVGRASHPLLRNPVNPLKRASPNFLSI